MLRWTTITMLTLSVVFCVTSYPFWLPVSLGDQFPNCVSGRVDSKHFALGALSQKRLSTLFVTRARLAPGKTIWSERRDGHFCTFNVPTTEFVDQMEPKGFKMKFTGETIGWQCPYPLMIVLWGMVYYWNRNKTKRLSISDLLGCTSIIGLIMGAINCKIQLVLVVLLNIATLILIVSLFLLLLKSTAVYLWNPKPTG